ncbi:MAG: hypothetical protein JXR07_05500 [Reichenbachiella sp.]
MKEEQTLYIKILAQLLIVALLSIWFFQGCTPPEPFPNKPKISFNDLKFKKDERNGFQDSLILYFDFEDGDGDLGLERDEIFPPYHDFSMIVDSVASIQGTTPSSYRFVTFGAEEVYLPFYSINPFTGKIESLYSEFDNRPSFNCDFYDTLRINESKTRYIPQTEPGNIQGFESDTVYLNKNPKRNNMFVDFYIDIQGNGNYELFKWEDAVSDYSCGPNFNGRFPIWDSENLANETSLQGTIKYSMLSLGFEQILRTRSFKLQFYIVDRSFNYSDTVLTEPFTLQSLLRDQSQE